MRIDRGFASAFTTVTAISLLLAGWMPGGAAAIAGASPSPLPTTFGMSVIEPLREIGRVRARTTFCKAFLTHASLGVSSAINFERSLLATLADFRSANLGDELNKHKSLKQLEKDLNGLADLSLAGRAELEELKSLETDPARHEALVDFTNALNGAKARQMELARKLARTFAIIAEQPVYTNVTLPGDRSENVNNAFAKRGSLSPMRRECWPSALIAAARLAAARVSASRSGVLGCTKAEPGRCRPMTSISIWLLLAVP